MEEDECINHQWGYLAAGVVDAPKCISSCRTKFLNTLLSQTETFDRICERLSDTSDNIRDRDHATLWDLYCCDSQLCGVDNLESGGEDRTVPPRP